MLHSRLNCPLPAHAVNLKLVVGTKNLPNVIESEENQSAAQDRNKPTVSGVGGKCHNGEIRGWWKDMGDSSSESD